MSLHRKPIKRNTEPCKFCGGKDHRASTCFRRPRKPLRQESLKSRRKRLDMAHEWFTYNPPDMNGGWECYLKISKQCPIYLARDTITLEHVFPRIKYPELKFVVQNIKPSCSFCNKLKGRNTLAQLALLYPNIAKMITSEDWIEWETDLMKLVNPELH